MTDIPAPLTPADCDLRDFAFMPLDVVRLRDSDLVSLETAEAFRAAVMLWCASWHQLPAGSLPDDDRVLANLAGYGRVVKEWLKDKPGALRGWIKCSDGRLYHPVVSEKAKEAWVSKLERQWRTECARIKKHAQRHGIDADVPDFETWLSSGRPQGQQLSVPRDRPQMSPGTQPDCPDPVPGEMGSKGQGEGQGQGQGVFIKGNKELLVGDSDPPQPPPSPPAPPNAAGAAAPQDRGKRLPKDWALPKAWGEWALAEFSGWTPEFVRLEADKFRDHWTAKSGGDARKVDWFATWRNWCRNSRPPATQGAAAAGAPSVDPESRSAIESVGIAKGIGPWNETEQWAKYKARVRGPSKAGFAPNIVGLVTGGLSREAA